MAEPPPRAEWRDGTLDRPGWICRYVPGGASLRATDVPEPVREAYRAAWMAVSDTRRSTLRPDGVRRAVGLLSKLVHRGADPPIDPLVERDLLESHGLALKPSPWPGDLAFRLAEPHGLSADDPDTGPDDPDDIELDPDLGYDSPHEAALHRWIAENLGATRARWALPQAPLEVLAGTGNSDDRRCDLLIHRPGGPPVVVEVDGPEHEGSPVDRRRDEELEEAGCSVVRVANEELEHGDGPGLRRLGQLFPRPQAAAGRPPVLAVLETAVGVQRLLGALIEALNRGLLEGDRWVVRVHDPSGAVVGAAARHLDLFAAVAVLAGEPAAAPADITLIGDGVAFRARRTATGYDISEDRRKRRPRADLVVHLETHRSPVEPLPTPTATPTIVVRSVRLPVVPHAGASDGGVDQPPDTTGPELRWAAERLLGMIFAKEEFREGQLEAIAEVVAGRDCAVLLPTGAGKSLIYQLAGLIQPGRTLVIAPLVSLIEDQVRTLQAAGIDRVSWLTAARKRELGADALMAQVARAEALFILVAPERLQSAEFRVALTAMARRAPVNLAVVDEAHCVSEWGHQFRPSYLRLGSTIAETCGHVGRRPPILALTGTASRAVLLDVLRELDITERTAHTLVRPRSFDRPELTYEVDRVDPEAADAVLETWLEALPDRWGMDPRTFFRPAGDDTMAGIVFCTVVNGPRGVLEAAQIVRRVTGGPVGVYSGSPPRHYDGDWDADKRAWAAAFMADRVSVLVSTNAFGMGIDKPNIRWIVHFGLPGSIEGYYQEVGRAGRDRRQARCVLIVSEYDEQRDLELLAGDLSFEELRRRVEAITKWSERDDLTTALYFHFSSFPGVEAEHAWLRAVAEVLEPSRRAHGQAVPFELPRDSRPPLDTGAGDVRDEPAAVERALHRLTLLGVVDHYLVDWGARVFDVKTRGVTAGAVIDALIGYVERSQPGRVAEIRRQIGGLARSAPVMDAVDACGRALVAFIYDTIERSRLRSLREMWLAARDAHGDGERLRRRVLDYLAEGDLTPVLTGLAEQRTFDLEAWITEWDGIRAVTDAAEWRGTSARLLVSYPDHPGLLVSRALAELADPEGDLDQFTTNLRQARAALDRYGLDEESWARIVGYVVGFAGRWGPRALVAAVVSLVDGSEPLASTEDPEVAAVLEANRDVAALAVVDLAGRLRRDLTDIDGIADRLAGGRRSRPGRRRQRAPLRPDR